MLEFTLSKDNVELPHISLNSTSYIPASSGQLISTTCCWLPSKIPCSIFVSEP
ncbi:hypothetical protein DJ51_5402 [Bacillus cereus]|nr:hypothetical protein DJ51_5402 [Bacillus cereus]